MSSYNLLQCLCSFQRAPWEPEQKSKHYLDQDRRLMQQWGSVKVTNLKKKKGKYIVWVFFKHKSVSEFINSLPSKGRRKYHTKYYQVHYDDSISIIFTQSYKKTHNSYLRMSAIVQ